MADLNEQLIERKKIIDEMRAMVDKTITEKRDFDATEKDKYEKLEAKQGQIKAVLDRAAALDAAERDNAHRPESVRAGLDEVGKPKSKRATPAYAAAFTAWLGNPESDRNPQIMAVLEKAVTTQGGYLVPVEFETAIRKKQYNANIMRQLCSVITTTAQTDIPMEGNLPTFGWIAELGTYGETDLTVGQIILGAYKLGGVVRISEELLQDAFLDVADYIADRSSLSAGFAEEAAYLSGDGTGKPTGLLTTLAGSGATVTSVAPTGVSTADVFALYYGLSRAYRQNAAFVFADNAMRGIRTEKATTGQYIWQPSLTLGAPDTLNGKPVYTSDFIGTQTPLPTAGTVTGVFGDFKQYQIVDRLGWSMQRLNEVYALNGQVGFRMWERTDGKTLRPEAFVTLTQHA